MTVQAQDGGVR